LEEVLFHEATHTSFDAEHANSAGWLAAQDADPNFISSYARDNPTREDVAESLLPWFALRHAGGLFPFQITSIQATIPNRLAYFDALDFQLYEPSIAGDFDGSRTVDGDDLAAWSEGFGIASDADRSDGDADNDGDVDARDFLVWQRQLGSHSAGSVAMQAVPEPGGVGWLAAMAVAVGRSAARKRRGATGREAAGG